MTVKEENIEDDLQALQLAIKHRGNPRVAVVIAEEQKDQLCKSVVENKITKKLVDNGFEVVAQDIYDKQEQLTILNKVLAGKKEYAAQLGAWFDTTYLVIGAADSSFVSEYEGLKTYTYQVNANILNADLAKIVSAHSSKQKGIHLKEKSAIEKAAAASGENVAQSILKDLAEEVSSAGHTIRLIVEGSDFTQKSFLQKRLKAIRLTENVYLRGYENNTFTFDVVSSLPTANFAEALLWWDMNLEIKQVSSNLIRVAFVE